MKENRSKHNEAQSSILPWIVWGLGCIFYFYENLIQVSPGVMSNELMRDFAVTSQTLGVLSGVYFYSYAGMQLPGGLMIDYFGPKRLLITATTVCALGTIAFGMTSSFYMACLARLMIGFGSAFAVVGTMKLATNWFGTERFAFLTGLMVTIGMLGSIGGEAPLALLVDNVGWRECMMILGCVGIILAVLIFLTISDKPRISVHKFPVQHEEEHVLKNLATLIKNKQIWLVAFYGGLMYLSTPVFCGLWGVPYLMLKMSITKAQAANAISQVFIGWVIASPLWGIFSNYVGRRKLPMYISSVGCLLSAIVFIYLPISQHWILQVALLTFGFFSAAFLPAFSVISELCNRRYVATGLSFMNMMNMIGIALIQPLIGSILDRAWEGTTQNGVRVYSIDAYQTGLSILPAAIFIALMILPFIRETYCKNVYGAPQTTSKK
jgi:MFS family permease